MAFRTSLLGMPAVHSSLTQDGQPPCDMDMPMLLNLTEENSPQAHGDEIISDCAVLSDKVQQMGDQNGNFAIPCSPAPDPFLFTSYGRCSLSFQCATKNNNGDNAT